MPIRPHRFFAVCRMLLVRGATRKRTGDTKSCNSRQTSSHFGRVLLNTQSSDDELYTLDDRLRSDPPFARVTYSLSSTEPLITCSYCQARSCRGRRWALPASAPFSGTAYGLCFHCASSLRALTAALERDADRWQAAETIALIRPGGMTTPFVRSTEAPYESIGLATGFDRV